MTVTRSSGLFLLPISPSLLPVLQRQNQRLSPRDSILTEAEPVHPPLQPTLRSRAFRCIEHTNCHIDKIGTFVSREEHRRSTGPTMISRNIMRRLIRLQRPKWNLVRLLALLVQTDINGGYEAPALELCACIQSTRIAGAVSSEELSAVVAKPPLGMIWTRFSGVVGDDEVGPPT